MLLPLYSPVVDVHPRLAIVFRTQRYTPLGGRMLPFSQVIRSFSRSINTDMDVAGAKHRPH